MVYILLRKETTPNICIKYNATENQVKETYIAKKRNKNMCA